MVAPVNEFDIILQAESPRTLSASSSNLILSTTANTVFVNAAGTGSPAVIKLVATPINAVGTVVFSTAPTVPLSIDSSGLIATLLESDMGGSSVVITATLTDANGIVYVDSKTVSRVTIGSLGYTGALNATANNTAQGLLSARPTGANGDFYFATDTLTLYQKLSGVWGPAATIGANASNFTGTLGGDNLMNNSGFEAYDLNTNRPYGYSAYNNANISTSYLNVAGRTGGRAFAIRANATGATQWGLYSSNDLIDGTVAGGVTGGWQPNKTYVMSFKARKVNGAGLGKLWLRWNANGGGGPAPITDVSNPPLSTAWQTYTFRFTWPATVEGSGHIYLDAGSYPGSSVAVNDEFHVDELIVQEGDVYSEWFPSSREAKATADTAITVLNKIADDGTLSKGEKSDAILKYMAVDTEWASLIAQADSMGVNRDAYNTAHQNLNSYLVSIPNDWSNTATDSPIDPTTWRNTWKAVYDEKQKLINAMADKANTNAAAAQATANTAITALNAIASDDTLSKGEKPAVEKEWAAIYNESANYINQASALGISSADYTTKLNALNNYLGGISGWGNHSVDSTIDHTVFQTKFSDYYVAKAALISALAGNGTKDITLIGRGVTVSSNYAKKTNGSNGWDADAYSVESFVGGAYASATVAIAGSLMFGLNSDPTANSSYDTLDFALYLYADGTIIPYASSQNLTYPANIGTWTTGDSFTVQYDGTTAYWLKGSTILFSYTPPTQVTAPLYFDSAFLNNGAALSNIRFGPLSNTYNGNSAYNAVNDATNGLAQKLKANAPNILSGSGGLVAGSLTYDGSGNRTGGYGVALTQKGILGYDSNGLATFTIDATTGAATFGGTLTAPSGTLGSLHINSGGGIHGGDFTGFAWPAAGGSGFYIGPEGMLFGNYTIDANHPTRRFLQLYPNGNITSTNFSIVDGVVTLTGPTISNPSVTSSMTASITNSLNQYYWSVSKANKDAFAGSYNVSVTGGSGNYTYVWSVSSAGYLRGWIAGSATLSQISLSVAGDGGAAETDYYLTCIVTDTTSNISKTVYQTTTVEFS